MPFTLTESSPATSSLKTKGIECKSYIARMVRATTLLHHRVRPHQQVPTLKILLPTQHHYLPSLGSKSTGFSILAFTVLLQLRNASCRYGGQEILESSMITESGKALAAPIITGVSYSFPIIFHQSQSISKAPKQHLTCLLHLPTLQPPTPLRLLLTLSQVKGA